jgi:hypothetical protein
MSASRTTKRCRVSGRNCRFGNAHLPQVPEFANRIKPCGRDQIVFMRAPAFHMLRAMDLAIADHGRAAATRVIHKAVAQYTAQAADPQDADPRSTAPAADPTATAQDVDPTRKLRPPLGGSWMIWLVRPSRSIH